MPNISDTSSFQLNYVFEEALHLKFQLYKDNEIFYIYYTNIVHLVSRSSHIIDFEIGQLYINTEEIRDQNSAVSLRIIGKISGGFLFWKPHYCIKMWRELSTGEYISIYHSENSSGGTYKWKLFTVPFKMLSSKSMKFTVHNTSDELLGEVKMSMSQLLSSGYKFKIKSINHKIKGYLKIEWSQFELQQNFIDYLRAGINIKIIVAVDYTASNFPYTDVSSNHYICDTKLNPYEACISSVSNVLEVYNKDHLMYLYGFGGIPKGRNEVSHCFKIGVSKDCNELLSLYRESLREITLSRPTHFHEIINEAQNICQNDSNPNSYYVVLILTDGDIHDFPATATSIIYSCKFPLSFIIIGIGIANFKNMVTLDSDNVQLKDREGRLADRDIVQFIPFDVYKNHSGLLASKVLEEIPDQICGYMKYRDRPNTVGK